MGQTFLKIEIRNNFKWNENENATMWGSTNALYSQGGFVALNPGIRYEERVPS